MARKKNGAAEMPEEKREDAPEGGEDVTFSDVPTEPEEVNIFDAGARDAGDEPSITREPHKEPTNDGSVLERKRERDTDEYSKSVQRRINREIALRKRTEARLQQERVARQQLEERLAKIERMTKEEQTEASIREIEAQIREVAAQLAKAKEEGDTTKEVELQIRLDELQGKKVLLESQKIVMQGRPEPSPSGTQSTAEGGVLGSPNRERVSDWVKSQRGWWNTARWRDARQDAMVHDENIIQEIEEGSLDFEPYSDEHFEELNRRLKRDYPELELRTLDGKVFELEDGDDDYGGDDRRRHMSRDDDDDDFAPRPRTPARRAPMGGFGDRDGRRERNPIELARRGKVELTPEDFETMRRFKLDPNNPEHKKYFARERARTLLSEGAKSR